METIHQISNKFLLLKKRMRDNDINELTTKANLSFINTIKHYAPKKAVKTLKPNHKFILETSQKHLLSEIASIHKVEIQENNIISPASLNKAHDKKKIKKPQTVNKIPRDDLINIAFDKNALKSNNLLPKKIDVSKPITPIKELIKEKPQENMKIKTNDVHKVITTSLFNEEYLGEKMGDRTPAVEDDVDNKSSNSFFKKTIEVNNEEGEDGYEKDLNYFDEKAEIFDNNNLFNDDDYLLEVKSYNEDNNAKMNAIEKNINNSLLNIRKNSNSFFKCPLDIVNQQDYEMNNEANEKLSKEKTSEIKEKYKKVDDDDEEDDNKQGNEENILPMIDNKIIIPLLGFENFDSTKHEYFNQQNGMDISDDDDSNNDNEAEREIEPENNDDDDDRISNHLQMSKRDNLNENKNNKENIDMTYNKSQDKAVDNEKKSNIIRINNINKKNNKIIDDEEDSDYVNVDEKKERTSKQNQLIKTQDKKEKQSNTDNPLVTINDSCIKLNLKLNSIKPLSSLFNNDVKMINNKSASPHPSNSKMKGKPIEIPSNKSKILRENNTNKPPHPSQQSKPKNLPNQKNHDSEITHSHHHHHHHHNSNINNITVINNTIIPPSSASLQLCQPTAVVHEFKKKEYDIYCLSILNNLLTKIKTKITSSTEKTSSTFDKSFNNMINMTIQLGKEDQPKRVKLVTEKTMKLLISLFDILENEKKREQYLYDVLEILDVIDSFQHKTKANYSTKIPQWFKTLKLVFKYIVSLFKMKGYSTDHLKNLINQEDSNSKTKNLLKFTKTYKSFNNSIEKLKKLLSNNKSEDKKQSKINDVLYIYLETNPNSIEYRKCFKVSKKFIEYIFEYLSKLKQRND